MDGLTFNADIVERGLEPARPWHPLGSGSIASDEAASQRFARPRPLLVVDPYTLPIIRQALTWCRADAGVRRASEGGAGIGGNKP